MTKCKCRSCHMTKTACLEDWFEGEGAWASLHNKIQWKEQVLRWTNSGLAK